jgi:uncharacterized membrane protein YfcA
MLFLASFVDSVAGGGGLISIPSWLAAGFPVHFAYGTNKFTSGAAALSSSIRYFRSGKISLPVACFAAAGALGGSWLGARLVLFLSDEVLRVTLLVLLPIVGTFTLLCRRNAPTEESPAMALAENAEAEKKRFLSFLIGLVIGAYEGFFGPGSGTFLILAFNFLLGMELLTACGTARLVNLAANLAALLTFVAESRVVWEVAVPCALFSIAGGRFGARCAITRGAKFVRPLMAFVMVLLFAKLLYDFCLKIKLI